MKVKQLIDILKDCNEEDEITFIFDSDKSRSWNRGNGLYEVAMVNVTGYKINNKIPLTNGMSSRLVKEDAELIFKGDD